ncbi:MAG: CoA-binding protein [Candidatus Caldarchaeum sp.]|nr:CoA-binding protein [Candidatus Caldarchaeum sp.]MDW8434963.1 CoA-binding protein [Candidatus Caldarchaeum sp.]
MIREILTKYKKIAVVGASREHTKPANYVPRFLMRQGYEVFPVNPFADEIFGQKPYKSLEEVPQPVEIVDVFRPSEAVYEVAVAAAKISPKVFWMQEGIYNREAAELLKSKGVVVVWNRCMMKEHNRLFHSKPLIPLGK